jgi:phosphoribosylformylglycinamidine cyclo-ligase
MARTFNCGIGMVAIVAAEQAESVATDLTEAGETVFTIGHIEAGPKGCTVSGSGESWCARSPWTASHHG